MIDGQQDLGAGFEKAARSLELVPFHERGPDGLTAGLQEGERHRASDHQRVDAGGQRLEHGELVRDLHAAQHA